MKNYIILLSGIIITFAACVPKRELISSQNRVKALQKDSIGTHSSLSDCNAQVAMLEKDKADLKKSIDELSASYSSAQANSNASLANSQMTIADQAKRLKDMEGIIQQE